MGETDPAILADVARATKGDAGAFERLFTACEIEVCRILSAQLGSRSSMAIDEALQDVRIYVHDKLPIYDPAYPFVVFVRGLTRTIGKRYRFDGSARREVPLDNVPEPADRATEEEPSTLFLEILELFLREGGYPHQQITFGFSVLLFGRAKTPTAGAIERKGDITGNPDRVVREVGPRLLMKATDDLILDIHILANVDRGFLSRAASALYQRLDLTVHDLFRRDGTSRRVFSELLPECVGQTRLEQYFGHDPRKSVADWTRAVKIRIQRAVSAKCSRRDET